MISFPHAQNDGAVGSVLINIDDNSTYKYKSSYIPYGVIYTVYVPSPEGLEWSASPICRTTAQSEALTTI